MSLTFSDASLLRAAAGYFAHVDFTIPARNRAMAWIVSHRPYFDGTLRARIPSLSRVRKTSDEEMRSIFE